MKLYGDIVVFVARNISADNIVKRVGKEKKEKNKRDRDTHLEPLISSWLLFPSVVVAVEPMLAAVSLLPLSLSSIVVVDVNVND